MRLKKFNLKIVNEDYKTLHYHPDNHREKDAQENIQNRKGQLTLSWSLLLGSNQRFTNEQEKILPKISLA